MTGRFFLVFFLLSAALAWAGWSLYGTLNGSPSPIVLTPDDASGDTAEPAYEMSLPPAEYAARALNEAVLLDRALFEPTRDRPATRQVAAPEPAAVGTAQPAPGPQPLTAEILGTILQDGQDILVMQETPRSPTLRISIGDKVQGWELVEISQSGAVFRWDEHTTVLQLLLE